MKPTLRATVPPDSVVFPHGAARVRGTPVAILQGTDTQTAQIAEPVKGI